MANLVDTSVNGDLRVTGTMFGTQAGNYATCATAAGTAAKAVTISGFTLTTGIHVYVKFTVTNTAAVASLTLNVSGTGAKPIKCRGGNNLGTAGSLVANGIYEFAYDGTNWEMVGSAVMGIKGANEGSYRWGNVNITAENVGAASSSHTHGNIANGGTLTDTAAAAAGNDYVVIRDADNAKIQTSTIKGTDVADAVSKKHSHSTLTLSTTAQAYDGTHTLALPSSDPYTSARTPASHTHGNIANGGTLTDTAAAAAGNDYVVIRDADNSKIQTSTIKGTDVADAVSKKHSHSTLTLSTTAQAYDGTHTLALPSSDPYTSARTPASHTHGNIANGGTLTDTAAAAAGNDYVVIRDADNAKIQTSTIKGTDVADAVSKKHSHSTLTLSTTAQAYDGSHTLALPSSDPYTSARTPASHTHGNIANGGTLTDTAAAAAGNDYVVIRDADNAKIQTSTIKGTDVADAVSKKHSHSTLTLSTTAQTYDGSHTLALPSSDPYTSARTPSSHTHGNIQNGGTLQTNDVTIASGDKLVITDSSDSNKVARASISFDGSTATKALTQKGTWETFNNYSLPLAASGTRGGIQIGYSESGTNYAVKLSSEKAYVTVPWTDTKVTQTLTTSADAAYPILAKNTTETSNVTDTTRFTTGVTLNPKNKSITATTFIGALSGNATTATSLYKTTISYHRPVANGGDGKQWCRLATLTEANIASGGLWYGVGVVVNLYVNPYGVTSQQMHFGTYELVFRIGISAGSGYSLKTSGEMGIRRLHGPDRTASTDGRSGIDWKIVRSDTKVEFFIKNSEWDSGLNIEKTQEVSNAGSRWVWKVENGLYTDDEFATYCSDKTIVDDTLRLTYKSNALVFPRYGSFNYNNWTQASSLITAEVNPTGATNTPSSHWFYLLSMQGEDTAYAGQIAFRMTGDPGLFIRQKKASAWNSWYKLLTNSDVTSTYSATGTSPVNGTAVASAISGAAGNYMTAKPNISSTNMNLIAAMGNCGGMASLSGTDTTVNPNGQTGWHHFLNLSYETQSGNMWQTQIANAAGSTDLWVRSRKGGTVADGTAWAAPWTRILTGSNWSNVVTKSALGLGNVNNTSDANKPVSTAQQTALDGKVDYEYVSDTSVIDSNSTAASCKTYFSTNVSPGRCKIVYCKNGDEYTLIFSKQGSGNYGSIIKYGYAKNTIYMLRYKNSAWQSTDWEVISAGSVNATTGNSITSTGTNGSMEILNGTLSSASGGGGSCSIDGDGISFTQGVSGTSMTAASISTSGTGTFTEGASAKGRPIDGSATIVTNSSLTWNAATAHLVVNRSAASTTTIDLKSLNNSVVYWLHVPRDNIIALKNSSAISTFYCYNAAFTTTKTTDTYNIRSHIKGGEHGGFSVAIVRSSTNFYVMMDY